MGDSLADSTHSLSSGDMRRSSRIRSGSSRFSETPEESSRSSPVSSVKNTPQEGGKSLNGEASGISRTLRKRNGLTIADPVGEALRPLTDEERRSWKGWVELESDPALFNYILREYGVQHVKIREIFSLDDESLLDLPKPVYGLIFLFKYRDDDAEEDEHAPKCPKHVWFANQTTSNACATVAMMNIVMNVSGIDLGDSLNAFKETTRKLKPPYRGQALSRDDFIRNIHNSFARRMDILNADLFLQNEYEKWIKSNKNPKKKVAKKLSTRKRKKNDEEEPGYHFIAYVPIEGVVWRLDGLQRQPINLGECGDNWIALAKGNILQRIAQYIDDGVDYSLLSLCKSPLRAAQEKLAQNSRLIHSVEQVLVDVVPDWRVFIGVRTTPLAELNNSYGLSKEFIEDSVISESERVKLEEASADPSTLITFYQNLVTEQERICNLYMQEVALICQEDEQAAKRKQDLTPMIYQTIKTLAQGGVLKPIVRELRGGEGGG